MTETTTKRKPRRKLSNISFEQPENHIALVSKTQGGPANSHGYSMLLKNGNFSEEFIQKASQVKVTMEITEFLRRMFGMYETDAEVLARALGFTTAAQDEQAVETQEDQLEANQPPEMPEELEGQEYEDYIMSKLEAFEIMKSLKDSDSVVEEMLKLDEDDMLSLLRDQSLLEKALKKIDKANKLAGVKHKESASDEEASTSAAIVEVNKQAEVNASETVEVSKETNMEIKEVEVQEVQVEKSAELEAVLKAHAEMQVELQKAKEMLAQYEAEKKAAIEKARSAELENAVKDSDKAAVLFKAVKDASDEDFKAVVKALAEMQAAVEKSALFQEQGATLQEEPPVEKENAVAKILKSKLAK